MKLLIGVLVVSLSLLLAGIVSANGEDAPQEIEGPVNKEWTLYDPRSRDPDAIPGPDETSLDIPRLSAAKSLREIYDLASDMKPGSASDTIVLSKIVTDFMQSCCNDYESSMAMLDQAGFTDVRDITERVRERPQEYPRQPESFDKAVYSEQHAGIRYVGALRAVYFYKIYLFFDQEKVIEAHALIRSDAAL